MTVLTETNIFRSDDLAIDFFSFGNVPNKNIAITFTPFGTYGAVSLVGAGYGGELLLRNGFDVVAFKSARNLWYQNVSAENIIAVSRFVDARANLYVRRVGYGSSMGAYAAIQFSRILKMDVVLALSPQFEIDKPYDKRWQVAAERIDFKYRIDASTIEGHCKYFVVFDPVTEDLRHVEKLRELIEPDRLIEIPTPYSGHPVGHYLTETGLLQDLAISVLQHSSVARIKIGAHRRLSQTYLYELSKQLVARNKNRSALTAIDRAISIDDGKPEFHLHRSIVLGKLDQSEAALLAIDYAIRVRNDTPELYFQRSAVLTVLGRFQSALLAIDKATSLDREIPEFHVHRSIVLDNLNQPVAALSAVREAQGLMKHDAHLMGAISDRLARHGDFVGALALIEQAIAIDESVLQFHMHKSVVCRALGDIPGAISAGEIALKISPDNAPLLARLSRLYAAKGGLAGWCKSILLAQKAVFARRD